MEQGDRGEGARENRGQERNLSERESGKRNLKKKHSFLFITVYHPVLRPIPI